MLADSAFHFGSGDGHIHALDAPSGQLAWKFATQGFVPASPAVRAGQRLQTADHFFSDSFEQTYVAVDLLFSLNAILSSPMIEHGVIHGGSADGCVYALE